MNFKIQILGSNAAVPFPDAFPTSQLITVYDEVFLVDCGEGSQIRLKQFRTKYGQINNIFISHLHGDHYFGLFGLISSYNLAGRKRPLNIYAHKDIRKFFSQKNGIIRPSELEFELNFHTIPENSKKLLFENKNLSIYSIPLKHSIPVAGFIFLEKQRPPNVIKEKIKELNLTIEQIKKIKTRQNIFINNKEIHYKELVTESFLPRKYAFITDTIFMPELSKALKNFDLLYHEATFLNDNSDNALKTLHSTAEQAATIAAKAKVQMLLLGHFSPRYPNRSLFEHEAQKIFRNTIAVKDGMLIDIERDHKINIKNEQ